MFARLLSSRGGRLSLAVVAGIVCIVTATMHRTAWFSDDGYTDIGAVTIDCGGAFSDQISVKFDDSYEQEVWDNWGEGEMWGRRPEDVETVFEGQTASQVCSKTRSDNRTWPIGAGVVSAGFLVSAMMNLGQPKSPTTPYASPRPASTLSAASPPNHTPAPAMAQPVVAPANPARWATDPLGRFQLRYWDGNRWTDHVSTNGVQQTDPMLR